MKSTEDDLKSLSIAIDRLNRDIKSISSTLTNSITKVSSELNLKVQLVKGLMELKDPSSYSVVKNTVIIGNTSTYSVTIPPLGLGEFEVVNGPRNGSLHLSPKTQYHGNSITGVYNFDSLGQVTIYVNEKSSNNITTPIEFKAKIFTDQGLELHNFVIKVTWDKGDKTPNKHGYPDWDRPIFKDSND